MPDPARPPERQRGRSTAADPPQRRGGGGFGSLLAMEARLATDLLRLLSRLDGVMRVDEHPEAFEWFDGLDGTERLHLPLARVRRVGSDVAFVDALPRSELERDPSLGGVRLRVELECAARGASYEIWTEDEIQEDPATVLALRVACTAERAEHSRAPPAGRCCPLPAVVSAMARRLGVEDVRAVASGYVGRSTLTGIPMVLLSGAGRAHPSAPLLWRPPPPAGNRSGAADSIAEGRDSPLRGRPEQVFSGVPGSSLEDG